MLLTAAAARLISSSPERSGIRPRASRPWTVEIDRRECAAEMLAFLADRPVNRRLMRRVKPDRDGTHLEGTPVAKPMPSAAEAIGHGGIVARAPGDKGSRLRTTGSDSPRLSRCCFAALLLSGVLDLNGSEGWKAAGLLSGRDVVKADIRFRLKMVRKQKGGLQSR